MMVESLNVDNRAGPEFPHLMHLRAQNAQCNPYYRCKKKERERKKNRASWGKRNKHESFTKRTPFAEHISGILRGTPSRAELGNAPLRLLLRFNEMKKHELKTKET